MNFGYFCGGCDGWVLGLSWYVMLKRLFLSLLFMVSILYATAPTQENVTKLYIAFFDRAPDAGGLKYWVDTKLSLEQIASFFFDQIETREKYPEGLTDADFIIEVYANLFAREPDTGGFEYWLGILENGHMSRSAFIVAVINGALDDDAKILDNKTKVGLAFVKDGGDDIDEAYAIMEGVTADPDSVNDALCKFGLSGCVVPPKPTPPGPTPPVNHKPVAVDDAYTADKDTALNEGAT